MGFPREGTGEFSNATTYCTSKLVPLSGPADRRSESVQIKISVRHGHLSDATQQFIRDKAEKLLHFFERLTMIEVTVDLKKDQK